MQNNNQEKIVIVFEDDTSLIISEILQKYNLEEKANEVLEKLEKEEPLRPAIVLGLVESIAAGKLSKKALASSLQEKLAIPKQTAENLAQDIENRLLPIARKASPEEISQMQREEETGPEEPLFEEFPSGQELTPENPPFLEKPLTPLGVNK